MYIAVWAFFDLIINKPPYAVTKLHHCLYPVSSRFWQIVFEEHTAVFAEINITVNDSIGKVLDADVGGNTL